MMFMMRNYSVKITFLLLFGLASCAGSRNAKLRFVADWKETWGIGQKTDVDYQDVYTISLEGGALALNCAARKHYRFEALAQTGNNFVFTLVVRDDKYSTGPSATNYQLKLNSNGSAMDGTATDKDGKKFKVRWDKQ